MSLTIRSEQLADYSAIAEIHAMAFTHSDFGILLGHPDYYPRFGYRTHMYGTCGVAIDREAIPPLQAELTERRITEEDVAAFSSMWHQWFQGVDLAIVPEATMLDWLSPSKTVKAVAVWNGSHRIGYLRYRTDDPHKVLSFLAADEDASMQLISYLGSRLPRNTDDPLFLPLHPEAQATRAWIPLPFRADVHPWAAGMVCPLNPANRAIQQYCDEVARGARSIGLVIWPVEFDVC